jgi:hypothetical protein
VSCSLIVLKFDEIAFVIVMGSRQKLSLSEFADRYGCILMNGRMLSFAYDIMMCGCDMRSNELGNGGRQRYCLFLE